MQPVARRAAGLTSRSPCRTRSRFRPVIITAASSIPSGRSWASRMFSAGKFRIEDSSVIVPLSESDGPGVHLQVHVVGRAQRLEQLDLRRRSVTPCCLDPLARPRMRRDDDRACRYVSREPFSTFDQARELLASRCSPRGAR